MQGIVQSGGTQSIVPISGANVRLYDSATNTVNATYSSADGSFTLHPPSTTTSGIFYVTAGVRGSVMLMAILGPELPDAITINELTTVAACYSGAQFLTNDQLLGDDFPLRIVAGMNANIVNVLDGTSSSVLMNSPNAGQTNALGVTQSLANLLAACVRDADKYLDDLYKYTTPPNTTPLNPPAPPRNTLVAMSNLAKWPANNVGYIFALSKGATCYQTPVVHQPDAWTIAVKVNDSGNNEHMMFGGPGNVAFDSRGRAWIGNNVVQGEPGSAPYSIVLDAAGHPALDDNGNKMTPFTGGGLLGAGFGITIDSQQRIWIGDFGWTAETFPPGSVSLFDENARPLSPPKGFTAGIHRVQGVAFDQTGNLWMASWGSGCVTVYPNAANETTISDQYYSWPSPADSNFKPFGIAIASDGTAWVTDSNAASSGIVQLRFTGSGFEKLFQKQIGKVMKGIAIDHDGNIWTASGSDDHVYVFDSTGMLIGGYQGGGINGPWGICLDGADNLWVGNFGPLEPGTNFHGRLTQLAGINAKGHLLGDGLSPQTGYTLPTAGDEVLLANQESLYGSDGPKCHIPMMRTTAVAVDAAGNVWSCNNWKPDFDIDIGDPNAGIKGNPGGDGVLIWVGLATP